ncbi:hypothetical protein DFA_02399 [Cavenderia fasciculata]|uniref:F-box domain-containing protein n=1 Tax=Cavenderia fasciculata TaxID=261658 RepID=F4PZC3_CACFS|nr:uncharacterized protein DFA_02399 [Cavenderia fasciculata]EGG19152.1 hypothetical protein DFA_02399 [Cavenderia fasciculata]|eukprot:XP_004366785.1 hypothetical protein DFA_02399 [Cavenderia fasciculata]
MTTLLSLSNLLLLHIITDIEDNVDIICLLLTCKKLYSQNSSENSVSGHQVMIPKCYRPDDYPTWIQDRITAGPKKIVDKSRTIITTALMNDFEPLSIDSLYKIPSIETLFINNQQRETVVDLSSISRLPNLQRLEVCSRWFKIGGQNTSLNSLKLYRSVKYSLSDLALTNRWKS